MTGIYGCDVEDLLDWLDFFNLEDDVHIVGSSLVGYSTKLEQDCALEINTVADSEDCAG